MADGGVPASAGVDCTDGAEKVKALVAVGEGLLKSGDLVGARAAFLGARNRWRALASKGRAKAPELSVAFFKDRLLACDGVEAGGAPADEGRYGDWSLKALRDEARRRGVSVSGSRAQVVARLLEGDARDDDGPAGS